MPAPSSVSADASRSDGSGPAPSARGRVVLAALALVLAVAWIYAPCATAGFVRIDDPDYVAANPIVARGLTWEGVRFAFTTFHASNWHPLTWLSHQLDVQLFGLDAGAHHLVNVALHAANALLAWWALARLTHRTWLAYAVALVFAVHPLRVESVAWIAERKDVLSATFFWLALVAYERHARAPSVSRWLVVATAFALGLLAKPMLVTLPFLLVVLDVWPLGRGITRATILEKVPLVALAAASSVVTFVAQASGGAVASRAEWTLADRLGTAVSAYAAYLRQLAWPSDLSVHVPHAAVGGMATIVGSALVLAALVAWALARRRAQPWLAVGGAWYLGTLVPVIGLVQVGLQARADRYTYLPLVGVVLALAWSAGELLARVTDERVRRTVAVAGTAGIALAFGLAARAQVATWRDSLALFTHAVAVHPESALARQSLGDELVERGRVDEGLVELRRAVELAPGYEIARNGLGVALGRAGRAAEGRAELERAVALAPGFFEAWYNLGIARYEGGDLAGAADAFARAVERRAWHYEARANLATALAQLGRVDAARAQVRAALELAPAVADDLRRVASIAEAVGDAPVARAAWERVLALEPGAADARERLGTR